MATFGQVLDFTKEFNFEWEIHDFFSLSQNYYYSPIFSFAGESWYLGIFPNGSPEKKSVGYIELYLYRRNRIPGPPISLVGSLGLKTRDGKRNYFRPLTCVFEKAQGYGYSVFLNRSTLSEKKPELVPSDVLTIVCNVEYCSRSNSGAGKIVPAKCSYCKKTFDADYLSSHEKKCLDKVIRCPTCSDAVALKKWFDHECDTARGKAIEKLVVDLADILESGEHSDVTVRGKDKEFRLHRSILAARNSHFSSIFKAEMKEKTTGIVSVDDCESDMFKSFINFVYTGKVSLSRDTVCALYEVADKYQDNQLKEECLCFMKNKVSLDSFVDFVVLALKHDEKELLQNVTDFFCKKTKEIIQGVKWQTFLRKYPTQANELHIKALDYKAK